jgi:hypothetical protein
MHRLLALALISLVAAEPARAYGVLAVGRAQDGSVAVGLLTRPDAARAERDAMMVCERIARRQGPNLREPCRVVDRFQNACAAAVVDRQNRFFHAEAPENYWARVRAQDLCRRAPSSTGGVRQGRSCQVQRSLCDRTVVR